ncbi:MAG: prepilin-type N-terminal cleavage/methylation domain-containing protein [Planctomycetia bacterium]|nr:prepilin-type N-terminal cleavage/methylation domain-containing protein [Planctomycetia bacterium]
MNRIGMKTGRSAFTLVEILVVISIIGLVAAVTLPAIGQAIGRARNAAIKTEIDMLHQAMMAYRNEYGSFPPASVSSFTGSDLASRHLQRIFPRIGSSAGTQAAGLSYQNSTSSTKVVAINPDTALTQWLFGYSDNVTAPVLSGTGSVTLVSGSVVVVGTPYPRKRLFDFDMTRVTSSTTTTPCQFYAPNKTGSPYVYIPSANYLSSGTVPLFTIVSGTYYAHRVPLVTSSTNFQNTAQPAFNPDTFQILSAGRDETFGTDDDLSNFWPSTRQDYIDSLSN